MKTMMLKAADGAPSARIGAEVNIQASETVSVRLRESATEALDHPVRGRVNAAVPRPGAPRRIHLR